MDLNSLPDELVAGIFKYNSYETVHNIRKLDSRLNAIAKTYDLGTRIPVNRLTFQFRRRIRWKIKNGEKRIRRMTVWGVFAVKLSKEMWKYHHLGEYKNRGQTGYSTHRPSAQFDIEKLLSTIQVREEAFISYSGAAFDDRLLQVLTKQKNCFRNVTHIYMCMVKHDALGMSKEKMIQFFAKCNKLRIFTFFATTGIENITNTEVFRGRKWTNLYLHRYAPGPSIELNEDKNFLYTVVKNCKKFALDCFHEIKLRITVSEFLDFFEDCLMEDNFFTKQQWRLPILQINNLTVEALHKRLKAVKEIERFFILDNSKFQNLIGCNIYLCDKPVSVRFSFEGRGADVIHHREDESGNSDDGDDE